MSSDQAAGYDGDLEPVTFIRMRAEDTFDGQERVMSKAAYDLQCRVTSHSASCGHPGYVPDDYLEHLDGLGIETTITAAELCAVGTWERAGGGYRILDWEAVEYALDWVRQRSGEDPQARAEERDHEASIWARMAKPIMVTPPCAACGSPAARIELVAPGQLPAGWDQWPSTVQASIVRRRDPGQWYLLFQSIAAYNGTATPSTPAGPGGSPRRSGIPSASPRSTRPGSTTMPGSARTATPPTATSTGTCPSRGTAIVPAATVPAATARAWTRIGNPTPRARRCIGVQLERKRW